MMRVKGTASMDMSREEDGGRSLYVLYLRASV
jgi:hypothetical protein